MCQDNHTLNATAGHKDPLEPLPFAHQGVEYMDFKKMVVNYLRAASRGVTTGNIVTSYLSGAGQTDSS